MELNYSLTENDYLQQQLYLASKSEYVKKRRKTVKIGILVLLLIIGGTIFLTTKDVTDLYIFGVLILIFGCFSSVYVKWADRVNFKKYVDSTFLKKCGIIINVKFEEDSIIISTFISDVKFNFFGFENISETKDYFFITLKTDENIMIPKPHIADVESLRNKLKTITENLNINFISELDWKW